MKTILKYFKPPFTCGGGYIFDSNGQMVLEVRGYGHISSVNNYDDAKACDEQDRIEQELTDILNQYFKNQPL